MSDDFKIILKSIEDIKRFRAKIGAMKLQLITFQAVTIRRLAEQIIVSKIHDRMRSAGFSEKIIEGTFLDNIELIGKKKIRLFFRSIYFTDAGYDVALGREEGTDTHKVVAGEGKVLPIPTNQGLIFRKSSNPSGVVALFIVKRTVRQFTESLQDEYNRQERLWFERNLQGIAVIAS